MKPQNVIIWAGLLAGVLLLDGLAVYLGPQLRLPGMQVLGVVGAFMGVAGPVAGHVLRRMGTRPQRYIVSFAIGESGAMAAAIAWMLTGTTPALGGVIAGTFGFASLYPGAPEDVS